MDSRDNVKLYEVSFWTEGPGRSHVEKVLVLAKNKTSAKKFVIVECGVYKADRDSVHVKSSKQKQMIVKYLDED